MPANRISAIINGTRSITADTAMRLGRTFNTTAEFWLNLQTTHDLTKAQAGVGTEIERRVRPRVAQSDADSTSALEMRPHVALRRPKACQSSIFVLTILESKKGGIDMKNKGFDRGTGATMVFPRTW